ncbi:MAG: CP12 domain-containing protein [Phormidesmis sp.]
MTTITIQTRTTIPAVELQTQSPQSTAETRLKAALEHARRLTQMYGYQNVEVAIAWETVEEMRAAQLRQPLATCQSAFDRYCTDNPHALECRDYDC